MSTSRTCSPSEARARPEELPVPRRVKPLNCLVAKSSAMQEVVAAVEMLASIDDPVLIRGEPGSGRELLGRVLHCGGPRQGFEFIGIKAQLAPAALAYDPNRCISADTLRAAEGGTLLIRDVSDVPRPAQNKLFELMQGASLHDVRIVCTCDPELGLAAEAEFFHPGLYRELAKHTVTVPPLRERIDDIPVLYAQFVRTYAAELGRGRMAISSRIEERLVAYPWPGNVGELKSVARRTVIRAAGGRVEPGDLDAVLPAVAERVPLEDVSFEDMVKSKVAGVLRSMDGYPVRGLYDEVLARVELPLLELVMEAEQAAIKCARPRSWD